jgi:hypothetical protein
MYGALSKDLRKPKLSNFRAHLVDNDGPVIYGYIAIANL